MNTASLELCKELCEVSNWNDTDKVWRNNNGLATGLIVKTANGSRYELSDRILSTGNDVFSAYNLGYLLRKLKDREGLSIYRCNHQDNSRNWEADCEMDDDPEAKWFAYADTPEDAAAKLCIELFKQGILVKSDS